MNILNKIMPEEILEKIGNIVERPINQIEKIEKYEKILKPFGFKYVDSGTNRVVFSHKNYPKVVFKIALDEQGCLDNLNENEKSDKSVYFPDSHDIDLNGYILCQQKISILFTSESFNKDGIQKRMRLMLKDLDKEGFILVDLGMDKHKNYGMDKDGNIFIIDFGYIEYKSLGNFNCPHTRYKSDDKVKYCKGQLHYTKDYTMVKCDECNNKFNVNVVLEGYTENKYAVPPTKKESFVASDNLQDFYKNFNTTRDRKTLTKYVEISHTSKEFEIGRDTNMQPSLKDRFLRKIKESNTQENSIIQDVIKRDTRPPQHIPYETIEKDIDVIFEHTQEVFQIPSVSSFSPRISNMASRPKPIITTTETFESFINYFKEDEQDLTRFVQFLFNKIPAIRNRFIVDTSQLGSDDIVVTNFVENSSSLQNVANFILDIFKQYPEILAETEYSTATLNTDKVENAQASITYNGIQLIVPDPESSLIQIYVPLDTMTKNPTLCFQKDGISYYVDIVEHANQLRSSSSLIGEEGVDKIITTMVINDYDTFDGNYTSEYAKLDGVYGDE